MEDLARAGENKEVEERIKREITQRVAEVQKIGELRQKEMKN